jgi:hypothetical protein
VNCRGSGARARGRATVVAVVVTMVVLALSACSATSTGAVKKTAVTLKATPRASTSSRPAPPPPKPTPTPKPKPSALPLAPPDAGTLKQTQQLPSSTDTAFSNAIHDIWLAITSGNPDYALPAFFPERAYEQVKAIYDPDSDWQNRLWYDFKLDVAALRPYVSPHAKLLRVTFPSLYTAWVLPGGCYNNIGYWHAPGTRVVYEQGGVTRSFGIASFISWRGVWYVIHLGALTRAAAVGVVDDPETGPGIPGPPGGC